MKCSMRLTVLKKVRRRPFKCIGPASAAFLTLFLFKKKRTLVTTAQNNGGTITFKTAKLVQTTANSIRAALMLSLPPPADRARRATGAASCPGTSPQTRGCSTQLALSSQPAVSADRSLLFVQLPIVLGSTAGSR